MPNIITDMSAKETKIIMGMPVTIELAGRAPAGAVKAAFDYFRSVDKRFSTYKPNSEISKINRGLPKEQWSAEMEQVMALCDKTKSQTGGYFDIRHKGRMDPSGLVKGWAIQNAAILLRKQGVEDFYIEAGGDIAAYGANNQGEAWLVGIRSPFNISDIVKVIKVADKGVATSGTYIRGQHIYNPLSSREVTKIKSLTVIGPDIYEADRFATAAFAMGERGIDFIEALPGFEGYLIDGSKTATYTSGFERYVA